MWSIKADGKLLYATGGQADSEQILIDPVVNEEINAAGSFSCIVPSTNKYYNNIRLRATTIEVFRNDDVYWRGRPINADYGYDRSMELNCEGALAFLNDTVYPPDTCKLRLTLFVNKVIAHHNEMVNENRQIHVGTITMDDVEIEYNGSYIQTMEVIRNLVDTYGGYLVTHYVEGGNYFDWLKEIPVDAKETINIEEVIDVTQAISAENLVTNVIPIGKDGLKIGSEYVENAAASALFGGRVWQSVEFNDIEDPDELYNAGLNYLNNNLWASMQLEISALGDGYRVGNMYHARIPSFDINHDIALVSAETPLTDGTGPKYTFSAATIWTQINTGRSLSEVIDSAQHLKAASSNSLTSRTAKIAQLVKENVNYFSGDIQFSDGTKLTCVNGMITGGKSTEGDF